MDEELHVDYRDSAENGEGDTPSAKSKKAMNKRKKQTASRLGEKSDGFESEKKSGKRKGN